MISVIFLFLCVSVQRSADEVCLLLLAASECDESSCLVLRRRFDIVPVWPQLLRQTFETSVTDYSFASLSRPRRGSCPQTWLLSRPLRSCTLALSVHGRSARSLAAALVRIAGIVLDVGCTYACRDVAWWSVAVCLRLCVLVVIVNSAETAEPMRCGLWRERFACAREELWSTCGRQNYTHVLT